MRVLITQFNNKTNSKEDEVQVIANSFYEASRMIIALNSFYVGLKLYTKNNNTFIDLLGYTYKMERIKH